MTKVYAYPEDFKLVNVGTTDCDKCCFHESNGDRSCRKEDTAAVWSEEYMCHTTYIFEPTTDAGVAIAAAVKMGIPVHEGIKDE